MAYEPKEWVCGETITADGLNNLEEGVQEALECCDSSESFEVVYDATNSTINHTFEEIKDAYTAGKTITARIHDTIQGVGDSTPHPIDFVTNVLAVGFTMDENIITFDFTAFEYMPVTNEPLHVRVLRVAGYMPMPTYSKKTVQLN